VSRIERSVKKFPPAAESLIQLIRRTRRFPAINAAVDAYNITVCHTHLALGVHDLDRLNGSITFRLSSGGESFRAVGSDTVKQTAPGDYLYADEARVLAWLDSKDSDEIKLSPMTKNVLIVIQGTSRTSRVDTRTAIEDAAKSFKPVAGDAAAPTQHLRFSANESCSAGRPFLDAIDVSLGVPPLRAFFDLQAGKAELVELAPDVARRATQSNTRVWASSPLTLYALRFDDAQPQSANDTLRESLALSLDRVTMAGVLLQKQGEPAAALLPQWLSGYAFLFRAEMNLERAKQLRASLPANVAGGTPPLRVHAQASGDLARLLAERVAVNARQAGLSVQPSTKTGAREGTGRATDVAELHLFAWRYSSLSPGEELREFVKAEQAQDSKESNPADPDRRYAWERKILEERKLIPLVALPDYAGLAPTVRDWQPSAWGEWRLADVWLEPAGSQPAVSRNPSPAITTTPGVRP
jgi:hypothetical protein